MNQSIDNGSAPKYNELEEQVKLLHSMEQIYAVNILNSNKSESVESSIVYE